MAVLCGLCDGSCVGADLEPLLDSRLTWLWEQIGRAADRRGDATLTDGVIRVRVPDAAEQRAAAVGLVGGRTLTAGQNRIVKLELLTQKLRVRGSALTPGSVAAHALRRPLAVRAAAARDQREQVKQLKSLFFELAEGLPRQTFAEPELVWNSLQRSGWITRLSGARDNDDQLVRHALSVLRGLPGPDTWLDRRQLASAITENPHALDHGTTLASLVIAMLCAGGRVQPGQPPRHAWGAVGIRCDDVVGGLVVLGIVPVGWSVPMGTPVTLPPRVLSKCDWPAPPFPGYWVFVTENPSVISAAADLDTSNHAIRLVCTNGTPSDVEIDSMARLAACGWRLAVRADFDAAGLSHVGSILKAITAAVPWRMRVRDYLESLPSITANKVPLNEVPETPWDASLSKTILQHRVATFEESLLPDLIADLQRGLPDVSQNEDAPGVRPNTEFAK
jgi:uncharacterized protein (TIGR02679 family)